MCAVKATSKINNIKNIKIYIRRIIYRNLRYSQLGTAKLHEKRNKKDIEISPDCQIREDAWV